MTPMTIERVEESLRQLSPPEQWSVVARLIQAANPDDEALEDMEDILYLRRHGHEDDEIVPWEQVRAEMRAKIAR